MQFIKPDIDIDFIGRKRIAYIISGLLILSSLVTLVWHRGPRYGIDFSGGTVLQIRFAQAVSPEAVKQGLAAAGLEQAAVQRFGRAEDHEYLVRSDSAGDPDRFAEELLRSLGSGVEIQRIEMVGPRVGRDLQQKALQAIFYSLLFIAIYISGRFEQRWTMAALVTAALIGAVYGLSLLDLSTAWLIPVGVVLTLVLFWFLRLRYAMGAIVALLHDVSITVGVFSLLDKEFTLPIIAALLTIIGYSLNDTIIVFDRIRENIRNHPRRGLEETINRSINETMSRTILTSGTTLIVVSALTLLGGGIIHDFALALMIGILVGTYSSIFVASPILLLWRGRARRA